MKTLQFLVLLATAAILPVRGFSQTGQPAFPVAETNSPQIQALAQGLQNDPVKIFNYVHDHIQYTHYFGSKKGAQLTLLERSGNDFDQSALLVALLHAAGYTNTGYQFRWIIANYDDPNGNGVDLRHWLRITLPNTNWLGTTKPYLDALFSTRGYPEEGNLSGQTNWYLFQHVFVNLTNASTLYKLDPAFKVSQPILVLPGFSLANAMGFSSNTLMSASVAGGTDAGNYVTNLNEANIRGTLAGYTTNLLNYLQSNAPNASVQQILGGWQILPSTNTTLSQIDANFPLVPYAWDPPIFWTCEPTNLMATLKITFAGTNYQWFMPQLQGQKITLTFSNNGLAQLWQEDALLAQRSTSGAGTTNVLFAINFPFGRWDDTNNTLIDTGIDDQTITNVCQSTNATYVINYAFEPDWNWLQQRQNQLDNYRLQGLPDTSRQVLSETLNIMGLNWLLQTAYAEKLLAVQLNTLPQYHYRLGRMAQETGHGYYIDMPNSSGLFSASGMETASQNRQATHYDINAYFASALEHGIIEQFQGSNLVAASTIKMLQIANTNKQAIYLASSTNWTTVKSKLINYDAATSNLLTAYINAGYYILLPQNGSNHVTSASGSWAGYGYVARLRTSGIPMTNATGMLISGGYHGGYAVDPNATADTETVDNSDQSQQNSFTDTPLGAFNATGADPVDMASGAFQIEHSDLSLGQAEPRGITLTRYYSGTRRFSNPAGMAGGWIHNYSISANTVPAPQPSLGGTTPAQAAAMLAATCAAANTYDSANPDPKNWTVAALIAKWGIDQLNKNGASIVLGKDTVQFVRQPNGAFTPPPGSTMTLAQNGQSYSLSQRRGNSFIFDSLGRLTNIVDQYNQALLVSYLNSTSSLPYQITDWKGRKLTFSYTGGQLTSVADNSTPARSISYGYSTTYNAQGDLTTFTDAEGKSSTYAYDTNHQIIATIDALSRMVVSNVYDGFNHVATQYSQASTNKAWQIYWSGWQTVEQDPAGGQKTYSYDDASRLVGLQDPLGNLTQSIYDGQNHVVSTISPLGEINQFSFDGNNNITNSIDALGFTNQFIFDNQNNLIRSVDPRGNPTTYGYNPQFSLTGQTNGAGDFLSYSYNTDGTLHTRADAGGTTTYGYDSYGTLNSIAYPPGLGSESFANNSLGDPLTHTDGNGNQTIFQYNARRQLTNSVVANSLTNSVSVDAVGNIAATTDPRGNITSNTWSATRHLLATTLPTTPQGVPVVTNGYDSRDWLVVSADALKNQTLYTNDLAGRLVSVTDSVKRTARFTFDNDGRKLTSANAGNETNSQTLDARGSLLRLTDGAGHYSTRVYDSAGNQIYLTNRNGKKWSFYFDAANRVTNTVTPLGRSATVTLNHQGLPALLKDMAGQFTTNSFDGRGRLTNRADSLASTFYGFDSNSNPTSVVENGKTNVWTFDAFNRVQTYRDTYGNLIQYKFDLAGNLTNLVYPGGKNVYYSYDAQNRLTNVTDWSGRKSRISYDLNSRVTSIVRPNGSYRTVGYDSAGQATNIMEQMANSLPIAIFNHGWTNTGTMAWEFAAPQPHVPTVPVRTMTYDDDNRLATVNNSSVTSDLDGNLTYAPLTNGVFVTQGFDARNRLMSSGGVTNFYDAANNRIGHNIGTNVTTFVVNPNAKFPQVLMRIKNGVTNYYIYGPGLLYQITETATATNTLTYHFDYRGSTIALSGDSGLVTDRIEYSLYALITYRVGTNDTPFLFNGRYGVMTDPNGLLYMRARYYNPYLCRFVSQDPSGFGGGLNWFAYANGNPISLLDPFGLGAVGENVQTTWLSGSDLISYLTWQQLGAEAASQNSDTFMSSLEFAANFWSNLMAPTQGGNEPQGFGSLFAVLAVLPGALAAEATTADSQIVTVLGSGRDVAPYVGQPGFNTFTGAGIPGAELDAQNALWLNNAIQRGDQIWLVTDPAAHQALMTQLNLQSAYLYLELPMLNQYTGINIIPSYVTGVVH